MEKSLWIQLRMQLGIFFYLYNFKYNKDKLNKGNETAEDIKKSKLLKYNFYFERFHNS